METDVEFSASANIKMETLLQLFPNGDFNFLKSKSLELANDDTGFETFIHDALSTELIPPSVEEPVEQQPIESVDSLSPFDVERYLEKCPDPFAYFDNLHRSDKYKKLVAEFLKDRFREVNFNFIEHVVVEKNYHILRCASELSTPPPFAVRAYPRPDSDVNFSFPFEEDFRKEALLFDHKEEIEEYMKIQEEIKKVAIEEGQVFECECCFSDDLLPNEIVMCTEAHIFCKLCVKRSVEVRIGDGLNTFPCIRMGGDCSQEGVIPMSSIKELLDANAYDKLAARIQEEEVRQAEIPGVEYCQRCEYAAIPNETDVVFKCAKCCFELCRLCNRETHVPRKCGETEQEDAEKQARKKNEEGETQRVLRRCGNCKKPYVKISGCNLVTCFCGTGNCYLCGRSPVGYEHVNACRGGTTEDPV